MIHMNAKMYGILLIASFCVGILLFCIAQEWIILSLPSHAQERIEHSIARNAKQKTVTLYRWQQNRWCIDTAQIVMSDSVQELVASIVSAWLVMAHEEHVILSNIVLQSALCSQHEDVVYLSLSGSILRQHASTYDNLLCIEGLLRTIRESHVPQIRTCMFLVDHAPMQDAYLDFTYPWQLRARR
jgi:hypothetical protein